MRLFIFAGEASGDAYGAAIAREVARTLGEKDLLIEAVGGRKLRAAGATMLADSSSWGAISVYSSLLVAPRALAGYMRARRNLGSGAPGICVPIDFGFINIRLARHAKRLGWKVLYFIPPGSWRRDRQGADLPAITDAIVTPFSWSAEILNGMGANAYWFGHPIKSLAKDSLEGDALASHSPRIANRVAILPGSRDQEIKHNLPAIAGAIEGMPPVEFAVAISLDPAALQARWKSLSGRTQDLFTVDDVFGVLHRARAAIVCSGTATLQAAVARCPMVVIYRGSKLAELEARVLQLEKRIKFISLPNIFLDRAAVPELVQYAANPENIRAHLLPLLEAGPARDAQLTAFEDLDSLMGPSDCVAKTATLLQELDLPNMK